MSPFTPSRAAIAGTLLALTLTGCTADPGRPNTAPGTTTTGSESSDSEAVTLAQIKSREGLDTMDAMDIVDHLDRLGGERRPTALMASVQPDRLVLSANGEEETLELPADRFYLSFSPYVDRTHECFHHSLTTCQGELSSQPVEVKILDLTHGTVLVDEETTTFANGFVGVWLPRDIEASIEVNFDGRSGVVEVATDDEAPTCVTTLRLA